MKNRKSTILALGADIKSRYCVLKSGKLKSSKDFGNLEDINNLNNLKSSLKKVGSTFDKVAFDMHPGYFSAQLSNSLNSENKIAVQHHHAHIASMLYLNNVVKPVIGLAFDGTGYGSDGKIWGGEFMVADCKQFKRVAHFKYLPMPGGELAVKQPWRMAFSLVYSCLGEDIYNHKLGFMKLRPRSSYKILSKMLKNNINSPLTSSVGRLFDAVSAILDVCQEVKFEAEAAIKLEKLASKSQNTGYYTLEIKQGEKASEIGYAALIKGLFADMQKDVPKEDIARKFHNSLARVSLKLVNKISWEYKLKDVVLSGGVFANKLLFESLKQGIVEAGFNLINDEKVEVNDLAICLGQAFIASKVG